MVTCNLSNAINVEEMVTKGFARWTSVQENRVSGFESWEGHFVESFGQILKFFIASLYTRV